MNGVSTVELFVRMAASLLVIGGLLWMVQRIGRRRLGGLGRSVAAPIEVTARKQLTRASSIALVRAGERNLLIGITDTGVSLIAEGEDLMSLPDEAEGKSTGRRQTKTNSQRKPISGVARKPRAGATSSNRSGTSALDALRDMTVRRT